ncbi:MAG TPA: hypothetical protein VHN80_28925, partial [Kineosporiaceae bacterium]|nr:hypothetical protein [Kineosporiaceae bacterium]
MTSTAAAWVQTSIPRRMLSKVPEITAFFWIIKLLSTAGGEVVADLFAHSHYFGLIGSLVISSAMLAIALAVQLIVRRYLPIVYWSVIVLVGVAGTLISDTVVDMLHLSHAQATVLFLIMLLAILSAWYATERTLSIHTITTTRRELYYWGAVMATFALGTAAGDLTAFSLGWGFLPSLLLYGTVFVAAWVAHKVFRVDAILTFWIAYVMTRPLGATFADYASLGRDIGGLGMGRVVPSAGFLLAIAVLVLYLAVTHKD